MSNNQEGIKIITRTPLYTVDWYLKWFASITLMIGMLLTSNNIYPINLYFHFVGIAGWMIVGMLWNDRALIVINTFALATITSSLFRILYYNTT